MRIDNSAFQLANTATSKSPRYVIRLFFDTANTDFVELTSHPDTATSAGATVISDVIKGFSGTSQKINPELGNSTIGGFTFQIVDKANAVTNLLRDKLNAGDGIRFKRVQCFVGYEGLEFSLYTKVLTFIVDGLTYKDGLYTAKCSDIQRLTRKEIFNPELTTLSKTITSGQTHIPVTLSDLTLFPAILHDASYSDRFNTKVSYVLIEEEIIAHTGLFNDATDGPSLQVITGGRGALNTKAVEHVVNAGVSTDRRLKVTEHILLAGAAPKVAYQVLTGHVAENICLQSEDMSTTWVVANATIDINADVAPNGAIVADRLNVTASSAIHELEQSITTTTNTQNTVSAWVKNDGAQYAFITFWNSNTNFVTAVFDLDAQTLTDTEIGSATANGLGNVGIVDYGDYSRIYINANLGAITATKIIIGSSGSAEPTYSNGRPTYLGVAGEDLLVWGAQASETNYFVPYFSTTSLAQAKETLPDNWHLGVDHELVRLENYTRLGQDIWNQFDDTGRHLRFQGHKKTDGKKFIETQVMYYLPAFMPIYANGQIGVKQLQPILSDSAHSILLDETNVASYSALTHDFKSVLNQIIVDWNFRFNKNDFSKTSVLLDSDSISKHQVSKVKKLTLRGVHTANTTDQDLLDYFDSMRDRFSGPPELINVTVMPSLNTIEVGDVIRLKVDNIRDFNLSAGTTIDRAFEVQQVATNWITGGVNLSLFGSSQKAGELVRTSLSSVVADSYYPLEGTELSTVLTISGGAITANGTLNGGDTLAEGIYYYIGNLTLNAGVTITINKNVYLKVQGFFTRNGSFDGSGQGHAGGVGGTLFDLNGTTSLSQAEILANSPQTVFNTNETKGITGGLGSTKSASGAILASLPAVSNVPSVFSLFRETSEVLQGQYSALPYFSVKNNLTALVGLPTSLMGTSGGGSAGVAQRNPSGSLFSGATLSHPAGAGGAGGAGLMILCRGTSSGISSDIDLSGIDGGKGTTGPVNLFNRIFTSGDGAGGHNGGLVVLLDGNSTPPDIIGNFTANAGDSVIPVQDVPRVGFIGGYTNATFPSGLPLRGRDAALSSFVIQYLPISETVEEELIPPPPDVQNFTVGDSSGTVVFAWTEVIDQFIDGYIIRTSDSSENNWDGATNLTGIIKGTRLTDTAIIGGTYRFYIRAINIDGQLSEGVTSVIATITDSFTIVLSNNEHPLWVGTKTNFTIHHTGVLVPDSQDADSTGNNFDVFDTPVLNPFPTCSYESSELDILFVATVRVYDTFNASLLPAETGEIAVTHNVDSRQGIDPYTGFVPWESGERTDQFFKFKFDLDTTKGVAFMQTQTIITDKVDTEIIDTVFTSSGGFTVNWSPRFHNAPSSVTANMVDGSAKLVTISSITATSAFFEVFDTSGTTSSGTFTYRAVGV